MTDSNNEYNTITAFNVEAFLTAHLSELAELPKSLASLFVESVTSVADGATQEQFQKQFVDFFSGWEYAKAGLNKMGIEIEQTAIPEYLSSLVGLGLTVGESAKALVSYAGTFDKAAGDVTAQFNEAFDKIFNDAATLGETKDQTAGRVGSYITLANTAKDIGLTATNAELDNLSKQLNAAAIAASADANAVIDRAIAEHGLIGISREAAIQQLVLAGDLDETKIAAADFSSALVKQQEVMFGGISYAQSKAVFLGTTLDNMGFTFNDVANIGTNITGTFKDMAEAMDFFDQVARAVYSEEEYAAGKRAQAQATFSSASKQAGLGENYTQDQFNAFFRDTGATGFNAMMDKAIATGDTATSNALKSLGASYAVLNEREKSYQSAVQQTSKDTGDAADKAKQLADLQKDVNAQLLKFSQSAIEQQIQDAKDNIEKLTASAAEAGGALKNLGELLTANLKDIVKNWSQPLLDTFHLLELGGNDFLNSLGGLKAKYTQLFADAKTLDSSGALKAAGTSLTETNSILTANYGSEVASAAQSLLDEYNTYVPGKTQEATIAAIYLWKDTMTSHAQELADLFKKPVSVIEATINTIADGRYTAAVKEAAKATETFSASVYDWVTKQKTTVLGTPMEQFKAAQDDAFSTYRLAMSGDFKSINRLTGSADTYISKIQQLYGNSALGQQMIQQVVAAVAEAPQSQTVQDAVNAGTDTLDTTLKQLPESFAQALKRVLATPVGTINVPGANLDISTSVASASSAAIQTALTNNPDLLSMFKQAFPTLSIDELVTGISSASRDEIATFLAGNNDILLGIQTAFNTAYAPKPGETPTPYDYRRSATFDVGAMIEALPQIDAYANRKGGITEQELLALSAPAVVQAKSGKRLSEEELAPNTVTPVSTVRSISDEQPTQKAAKANELQEIKALLANVVKELTELRNDERLATEAIIDANFAANGMSSDRITDATREQTVNLVYSSKVSVGIV